MSWTDERIEVLSKLWADGKSASQIATVLGGVSRNAVIGKIHRLGLSGRMKAPASRAARQRAAVAQGGRSAAPGRPFAAAAIAVAGTAAPRAMTAGALAVKVVEREAPAALYLPAIEAEVVPLHGGVTLFELSAAACRWPLGDPASDELRFCGGRCTPGEVYCRAHGELAFPARRKAKAHPGSPPSPERGSGAAQVAASATATRTGR